jgi:hypothetical protein
LAGRAVVPGRSTARPCDFWRRATHVDVVGKLSFDEHDD